MPIKVRVEVSSELIEAGVVDWIIQQVNSPDKPWISLTDRSSAYHNRRNEGRRVYLEFEVTDLQSLTDDIIPF